MKIYVVTEGNYSEYHIIAATIDKDVAEAIAKKFDQKRFHPEVEEFEDAEVMLKPCWRVEFGNDGSVVNIANVSNNPNYYTSVNQCWLDTAGHLCISVIADDSTAAIKIAAEKRAQYLAEEAISCSLVIRADNVPYYFNPKRDYDMIYDFLTEKLGWSHDVAKDVVSWAVYPGYEEEYDTGDPDVEIFFVEQ